MQQANHFVWNVDPTAFTIGPFTLPFPIAVWGLVVAAVIFYFGYQKLSPEQKSNRTRGKEPVQPALWKVIGLAIGALVVGQLLFMVLPSPTFQHIGARPIRWYGMFFAGAFIFGIFLTTRMFIHAGRKQEEVDMLFMYVMIATVIGARLGHVLFYDPAYYLRNPGEILAIWHGGLASHGAAIGILLAMYFYAKKFTDMSFLWLADRVVVVVATGGAFIRMGNFFNSEIVGRPSELPWAIIFPRTHAMPANVPRHPSMLYEALLCIGVFILLWAIYKRYNNKPPEGSLFGMFLVTLFGGRFFLEYFKADQAAFATGLFNMGQWLSIPLIVAGIWVLMKKVNWQSSS